MQAISTTTGKNDADRVASRVKEYFPELSVYTSFISPRWLCRVGDFRSIEGGGRNDASVESYRYV